MNKALLISLGLGVFVFVGAMALVLLSGETSTQSITNTTSNTAEKTTTGTDTVTTDVTSNTDTADGVTLAMVAEHSSETDCWMAIDGTVYDLTDYIETGFHKPGMDLVINECGTDATTLFEQEHRGHHATEAKAELAAQTVVGSLVN